MTQMIFVNLPVANLATSVRFYEAIGFAKNDKFSDETAAGMFLDDVIHVMLLTHDKWKTFTDKAIPDPRASAQVMLCLRRDVVDAIAAEIGPEAFMAEQA